jgi:RNA polymerase sigma-70 factor, ECF subfamily
MEPLVEQRRTSAIEPDPEREAAGPDQLELAVHVFLNSRPRLFGIAYRILRNPVEAEDVVQDAWLRWQLTDRTRVMNPEAFLVTATTRLALNDSQSARRRRETPVGPWLFQSRGEAGGPEADAELSEAVAGAVQILLATLTPAERAAYVLREAFDYPYLRIADLLHLRPANCRQLVRRARYHLTSEGRRPVDVTAHKDLLAAFVTAARGGDLTGLEALLVAGAASSPTVGASSDDYDPAAA